MDRRDIINFHHNAGTEEMYVLMLISLACSSKFYRVKSLNDLRRKMNIIN